VAAVLPLDGGTEDELLALAAAIDAASQHPVAKAIVRGALARSLALGQVTEFRSITGAGATALVDGEAHYVVSPEHYRDVLGASLDAEEPRIESLRAQGDTVVAVGDKSRVRGLIAVRDELRDNARAALEAIRRAGVTRIVMLTGDNETTAQRVARDVGGIDEVRSHAKPGDKAEALKAFAARGEKVAMVGDGVNDAPALAEAAVGVAMGAAGTDVALETADVALMADDLEKLAYALVLARRYASVARQNIFLSIGVLAVLAIGALSGKLSLPVAVVGHEVSELVVIASGLRMLRSRR
jgi:Cd2+/Zn2+-exporting ATPase